MRFVADGYDRAREASEPIVRAEVEREFAAELQSAAESIRVQVRSRMEREVQRRLDRIAPRDALY